MQRAEWWVKQMPSSADLQAEINAVAASLTAWGSEVINLPNVVYSGPALSLPGSIELRGKGHGTHIPPVLSRHPTGGIVYQAKLSCLKIMGNLVLDAQGVPLTEYPYGWRVERGKHCRLEDVNIDRVAYGRQFVADSAYNTDTAPVVTARLHCYEYWSGDPANGANQNGIRDGKLTATGGPSEVPGGPGCIAIYNSNFLSIGGNLAMEALPGNSHMKFIKRINSSHVRCSGAVRAERAGLGPLPFDGWDGDWEF